MRYVVDSVSSIQSLFKSWANVLRRSVDDVPSSLEVNILRHPSTSRPDGPDIPFVNLIISVKTSDEPEDIPAIALKLINHDISNMG